MVVPLIRHSEGLGAEGSDVYAPTASVASESPVPLPVRQVNRQYCSLASKLRNRVWVVCAADLDPEAARAAATLAEITSSTSQAASGQRGQVIPSERACVLGTLHFIFY